MPTDTNRQWILRSRPDGEPTMENFELREEPIPEPGPNEVLVRTRYMSVDPYMRGRMRDAESYANPWTIGDPMRARVVGEVVESNDSSHRSGDIVTGNLYWAEYATAPGAVLDRVETGSAPISTALHILGMPGLTAYVGTVEVGHVKPGDTVVVSGAAGAVGSVAGQIARIAGCRVVGIAGSEEKTEWLTDELGFDAAVDYNDDEFHAELARASPNGVDLYFENVGGEVSDAVLDRLNDYSRVAVCGKISLYNLDPDDERMRGPRRLYQRTRTRVEGFIVSDHDHIAPQATERLSRWVESEQLHYRESVRDGIESAPEAFLGLFEGENIGKQLVSM